MRIVRHGDQGLRNVTQLADLIQQLRNSAVSDGGRIASVLVQTPLTIALAFSADRRCFIFDSRRHGPAGGLIAIAQPAALSSVVADYVSNLVGAILDAHMCSLSLC